MILQIKNVVGEWNTVVYMSCLVSLGFAVLAFFFNFYFAKVVGRLFSLPITKSDVMDLKSPYLIVDFFTIQGVIALPIYFFEVFENGYDTYLSNIYPLHMSLVILGITFGLRRGLLVRKSQASSSNVPN
jgi:hypothetical protein